MPMREQERGRESERRGQKYKKQAAVLNKTWTADKALSKEEGGIRDKQDKWRKDSFWQDLMSFM